MRAQGFQAAADGGRRPGRTRTPFRDAGARGGGEHGRVKKDGMTTEHAAGPGGDGPAPGAAHDGAKDAQAERDARGQVVTAVLLLLATALGVRVLVTAKRTRLHRSAEKVKRLTRPAPYSVIRIAAAPHSVVYVVSAPSLGRSHVVKPPGPDARLGQGRQPVVSPSASRNSAHASSVSRRA
jgi:hypothetical protein